MKRNCLARMETGKTNRKSVVRRLQKDYIGNCRMKGEAEEQSNVTISQVLRAMVVY